jgi:frataxin-like iron-binding protein CyaY
MSTNFSQTLTATNLPVLIFCFQADNSKKVLNKYEWIGKLYIAAKNGGYKYRYKNQNDIGTLDLNAKNSVDNFDSYEN